MSLSKKRESRTRQEFLLTFFNKNNYQEKKVNGFWLIKQFNGETKNWQVAIYSEESYRNYKGYTKNKRI